MLNEFYENEHNENNSTLIFKDSLRSILLYIGYEIENESVISLDHNEGVYCVTSFKDQLLYFIVQNYLKEEYEICLMFIMI